MRINTNLTAMNTYTQYTKNQSKISSAVAKLSSGSAINSAADNAAGLAISEKMRAQIRGLNKASSNSQDAISLVQTAEGALSSSTEILQRMRELAVQSSSDTNQNIDRSALQDEFAQLQNELNDTAKNTNFNKKNLLDGSLATSTKSIATANIANSGMNVSLGNVDTGNYNFSVTTNLESAAVAGVKPPSVNLVTDGATSYFTNGSVANTVALGANTAASSLLNGNYTLSATYGSDQNITVTATGDNGQTFTAKINQAALQALNTPTVADQKITLNFNDGADDAFNMTLGLSSALASNDTNFNTLASNISKVTVSVAGGVTAQAAEYGVYANLTGADSVELSAGDSSVTFGNGVKISFDTLTSSDVDTANKASTGATVTADIAVAGGTSALDNLVAMDSSTIIDGALTITSAANATVATSADITVADSAGKQYHATITAAQADAMQSTLTAGTTTKIMFQDADGNDSFTLDYTVKATVAGVSTTRAAVGVYAGALTVTAGSSGHNYVREFSATPAVKTSSTASSFSVEAQANAGLTFQVGANEGDSMTINIDKMDASYLGVSSASVATQSAASAAINTVDKAISQVSAQRANLGAVQNRLQYKIDNLSTSSTNLTSAESQIRDIDMAKEMTAFTNANILSQAATAMLAQANSLPQSVLSLIQG